MDRSETKPDLDDNAAAPFEPYESFAESLPRLSKSQVFVWGVVGPVVMLVALVAGALWLLERDVSPDRGFAGMFVLYFGALAIFVGAAINLVLLLRPWTSRLAVFLSGLALSLLVIPAALFMRIL